MRFSSFVVVGALSAACAERQALPPGDELEFPETVQRTSAPVDTSKPVDHDALAASFQPTGASPKAERAPPNDFAHALAAAEPRLSGDNGLDAVQALDELRPLAKSAGPEAEQQLCEVEVRVRHANKDFAGAVDAAERWLLSCGPFGTNGCREKALSTMVDAAGSRDRAAVRARVATIHKHDACIAQASGEVPGKLPACLSAALSFYQAEGDALMVRRALIARVRAAGHFATPLQFVEADRACTQERCLSPARRELRDTAEAHLRAGDARRALLVALQDARLAFSSFPPDEVSQARTGLVEKTCAALDLRDGSGSCRKLEREATAHVALKDFSKQTLKGEGIPPATIKEVNDAFGVLLQDCLKGESERLEPPDSEHYAVSWVVRNDGRVDQVHLDKKEHDDGLLAQCLRAQFALWRYPRYKGELQHVEQKFVVSAHERRSLTQAVR